MAKTAQKFIPTKSLETTGLQASIELGQVGKATAVRKVAGKGLPDTTLRELLEAMGAFRRQLIKAGLKVPRSFSLEVTESGIEMVDEFIPGKDVSTWIKENTSLEGWEKLIETICSLNSGSTSESKVMLSSNPANWIWDGQNLHFIDLYPPTLKDKEGMIYPWVPEIYKRSRRLFTFNYGDTRGQLTKHLAKFRLTCEAKRYSQIESIALETLHGKLPWEVENYITRQASLGFPDMDLLYNNPNKGEQRLKELLGR